jgi:Tol biopolymer transport system component
MKRNIFFLALIILAGCSGPQVVYDTVSVPEEGGIKFTKLTDENEKIVHPKIVEDDKTEMLRWYAPSLIALSPDGKEVAYLGLSNDFHNLYIKEILGGGRKIQRTFNKDIDDMSFSPDGKIIAFTEKRNGSQNISTINAKEGVAVKQVAASTANELGPVFSPDGNSIFYTQQENDRFYIWNVDLETSLKTQYSEGFTPVLTPDGENLIVTRNGRETGFGEIWMINIQKGTETLIMSDPEKGFSSPVISPDGKNIVCVGTTLESENRPQNLDLYSVNLNGTNIQQLTFHGGHDVSPAWGPNGKFIYFLSQRGNEDGKFNVWRMERNF